MEMGVERKDGRERERRIEGDRERERGSMRKDSATKQLGLGGSRFSAMKVVIPPLLLLLLISLFLLLLLLSSSSSLMLMLLILLI